MHKFVRTKRLIFCRGVCLINAIFQSVVRHCSIMNKIWCAGVWLLTFSFFAFPAWSSSILPMTTDRKIKLSSAIFRGVVVSVESYQDPADGQNYTRTTLRVEEVFKGKFPALVKVI